MYAYLLELLQRLEPHREQAQTRGWGFDVEILYLATRRRLRVLEMPIDWHHKELSRVGSLVEPFSMLRDALAVRARAARGLYGPRGGTRRR